MSNPVQTYTNSVRAASCSVPFTTRPTVGNTVAVVLYAYFGFNSSTSLVVSDNTGNNRYARIAYQATQGANGGYDVIAVYFSTVSVNSGSPFTVAVSTSAPVSVYNLPYFNVCCYELSSVSATQPDATTYQQQLSGGTPINPPFATPTVSNDFALALMSIDSTNATWNDPSPWTVSLENKSSSQPVAGSIVCEQLGSNAPVYPAWTSVNPSTAINQCAMVLFRGASASSTFSPTIVLSQGYALPVKISGANKVAPVIVNGMGKVLQPRINMPSWFCQPILSQGYVLPAKFSSTGSTTLKATILNGSGYVLPVQIAYSAPILHLRGGQLSTLLNKVKLDSREPYIARQMVSGTAMTSIWVGGIDGQNKIVAGFVGFINGGPPSWTPQADGMWMVDISTGARGVIYMSYGGAWMTNV